MNATTARERGFALLIVLWTVVLLALLVTQLTASGRAEAQLAFNLRAAAVAEAAADGALSEGVFHALDSSERHWRADGVAHVVRLPSAVVEVRIDNEAGKININSASPELLAALLRAVDTDTGTSTTLSAAIVDWRFVDAQRGGGAKTAAYRNAGRNYGPPSAPFRSVQELGLVIGMTPALLARLSPHLTVYHDGEPDYSVADSVVRQALRTATGTDPARQPSGGNPEETVVAVTARAVANGGGSFVRRAVVSLGMNKQGGSLFQTLTWGSAER